MNDESSVPAHRPSKAKDVLIAILALCLCVSLAALIHETRRNQQLSKQYAEQSEKFERQQQAFAQTEQTKLQSNRALRRSQLAMKARNEAQGIALRLAQNGGKASVSRSPK